eukprot:scaffold22191_cov73-Skeletonema_marinoi.AAC.1
MNCIPFESSLQALSISTAIDATKMMTVTTKISKSDRLNAAMSMKVKISKIDHLNQREHDNSYG